MLTNLACSIWSTESSWVVAWCCILRLANSLVIQSMSRSLPCTMRSWTCLVTRFWVKHYFDFDWVLQWYFQWQSSLHRQWHVHVGRSFSCQYPCAAWWLLSSPGAIWQDRIDGFGATAPKLGLMGLAQCSQNMQSNTLPRVRERLWYHTTLEISTADTQRLRLPHNMTYRSLMKAAGPLAVAGPLCNGRPCCNVGDHGPLSANPGSKLLVQRKCVSC